MLGRRRILLFGLAVFSGVYGLRASSTGEGFLIAKFGTVQGLGAAVIAGRALSIAEKLCSKRAPRATRALGIWGALGAGGAEGRTGRRRAATPEYARGQYIFY